MTRVLQGFAVTVACSLATFQMGALKAAAGGDPNGDSGFAAFMTFLRRLGNDAMYIAGPVAMLALIAGGVMIMVGKSEGASFCGGAAVGIAIVLLAPSIMA